MFWTCHTSLVEEVYPYMAPLSHSHNAMVEVCVHGTVSVLGRLPFPCEWKIRKLVATSALHDAQRRR
jgi:hypothetical protein